MADNRACSRPGRRRLVLLSVASVVLSLASPVIAGPAASVAAGASAIGATRASSYAAYQNVLKPALAVPVGWTGSEAGCVAGAPSAAAQDATLTAVNFYRAMGSLPAVTFDAALSADAQQAALMMDAANALSHSPGTSWACSSAAGRTAAGRSNLALGLSGARAMKGYMDDGGDVGHRRWIMYPPQATMGSGSTTDANALYIFGAQNAPGPFPEFVAWPSPGYTPLQVEPNGLWSLSATNAGTSFSNARVTVTSGGATLPVTLQPLVDGYGNHTLIWRVDPGYGTSRPDRQYDVSVANIMRNGTPVTYAYSVTLFDGEINADQTITFAAPAGRTYGDPGPVVTATASSGLPVGFTSTTSSVCTASGATITLVSAGTCSIRADQPGDAIRNPAPPVSQSFTVGRKAVTVQAADATRRVGAANPAFAVTYAGLAYGQTLATSGISGAPSCTTPATPASPGGTYPITCGPGTLASPRYSFAFAAGTLTVGQGYQALSPARLLDGRAGGSTVDGVSAGGGAVAGGSSVNLKVTGRGGVPVSGVGAVVLNVTATGPTAGSFLTVWPAGEVRPVASNLNFGAGETVANLVVAKVGVDGQVSVFNATGSTFLIVDVAGWFP